MSGKLINKVQSEPAPSQGNISILENVVNVYAPFRMPDYSRTNPINLGIPEFRHSQVEASTKYSVHFLSSRKPRVSWDAEDGIAIIEGNVQEFSSGVATTFAALTVTEYQRQINNQILSHGAGVVSPEGKGVLIFGNQGDGKTSLMLSLCLLHGYKLVANDQVIFEDGTSGLKSLGGTKYITLRETAAKGVLSHLRSYFTHRPDKPAFENKVTIEPEELNIEIAEGEYPVDSVVRVYVDALGKEKTITRTLTPSDLIQSLFLAERVSRHISAIATPLINDKGEIVALYPSFDTEETRQNRQSIIESIFKQGFYALSGSDLAQMSSEVNQLIK